MRTTPKPVAGAVASTPRTAVVSDEPTWASINSRCDGSFLQSWTWGEFKSLHGWSPYRVAVERDGLPALAAQILKRSVGPFSVLYVPRGPMFGALDQEIWPAFTLALDQLARRHRATIAFLEPDKHPNLPPVADGNLGWRPTSVELQPLRTVKVRVDQDDESILAQMKSKTRYNVRLAGRRGITVREGAASDVVPFYELLEETSDRDAFGIHSVEYYADMLDCFGDSSALLLAESDGELAAGAIVLQHGVEAVYMFGASSRAHQRDMPTHLLQFEAMRWARERGCTTYDLWGIPPTDTPPDEASQDDLNVRSGLWGVYRFKQGFGGEVIDYPGVFERVYYPRLVNLWRRFRPGLIG